MRYSNLFLRTSKHAREFDSINATLLQKAGFIEQMMAGVYTFLPLGWRVLNKIEDIIRAHMDTVGAEMLMPAIVPQQLWRQTERLDTVDVLMEARGANDASRLKNDAVYVLNSTHEEVITPIAQKIKLSYRDLPFAVYQIQTKFRNEERPKSGLLRGREFRMKDLYSFHVSDDDRRVFYDRVKDVYVALFNQLGIGEDTVIALASGGDFTSDYSHEFNTRCETGEDLVYHDDRTDTYYNKEVAPPDLVQGAEPFRVSEVGNIFPLGTKFSDAFHYTYTDEAGDAHPVHMASYGIGSSRVMGVLVEKFHDDRGIVWPAPVAPFTVHLIGLQLDDSAVSDHAERAYAALCDDGIEVLFDDRTTVSAGEKLADADLIGIPWRFVVSPKTGDEIEVKRRSTAATRLASLHAIRQELHDAAL